MMLCRDSGKDQASMQPCSILGAACAQTSSIDTRAVTASVRKFHPKTLWLQSRCQGILLALERGFCQEQGSECWLEAVSWAVGTVTDPSPGPALLYSSPPSAAQT